MFFKWYMMDILGELGPGQYLANSFRQASSEARRVPLCFHQKRTPVRNFDNRFNRSTRSPDEV